MHFPAPPGQSPGQPGEVSFSCILPSQLYDEKVLLHLKETLGGVHPRSAQGEVESSREEMGCVSMNHSHSGCRSTWLLMVFANFLLHFCQELKESHGELKVVKMLTSSLTKVIKSSLSCLKVLLVSAALLQGLV